MSQRAAIFNPYWDTLGGGERYTACFAKVLENNGWEVFIQSPIKDLQQQLEKRFGITLTNSSIIPDIKRGEDYDLCFWVSDGSIPLLRSRRNILHFQVPFHGVNGKTLINKMKLFRVDKILCNSKFTKKVIDTEFGVTTDVLYPPVSTDDIKAKRKENIILAVGRFSQLKQAKRQDVLITAFRKLTYKKANWKLILAGGAEIGADKFLDDLKKEASGYPIEIIESPPYKKLLALYAKAKIYWSASGYKVDEDTSPEKVEHFGITLVEAMAAGSVPFAYNAGGHKEIIMPNSNGYLWNTEDELVEKTIELINSKDTLSTISAQSVKDSARFNFSSFSTGLQKLLDL